VRGLAAAVLLATISTLALGSTQAAEWTVAGRVVGIADGNTLIGHEQTGGTDG